MEVAVMNTRNSGRGASKGRSIPVDVQAARPQSAPGQAAVGGRASHGPASNGTGVARHGNGVIQHASPRQPPSARQMLAFLDAMEQQQQQQRPLEMFPPSESGSALPGGPVTAVRAAAYGHAAAAASQQRNMAGASSSARGGAGADGGSKASRPKTAPLRTTGQPRLRDELLDIIRRPNPGEVRPRMYGRVSLYDHATAEAAPHEIVGPRILRDYEAPQHGFPTRQQEDFLKQGEGLDLRQRRRLKARLAASPVNTDPPFVRGTGGIRLSFEARGPTLGPRTLLRTYYDNGTLDFVTVRWRGSRADALVWGRSCVKGTGGVHQSVYSSWAPEPAEVDRAVWLPIFLDGIRELDEPYRFLAIKGSEELILQAGDTIHGFADALVHPLKLALDTREPVTVAVALQLMNQILTLDPAVAGAWVPHFWQFAQVLRLFHSRGGFRVDMGYNKRLVSSLRALATEFMELFEEGGGPDATATVRRYAPCTDPAVTDAALGRLRAKAAAKAMELAEATGKQDPQQGFKPFTLF